MHISDKSGVILRFWTDIEDSKCFNESDRLEAIDNESDDKFYQRVLETIILNYADKKPAQELFKRLNMDGIFKLEEAYPYVDVIYQGDYLPYRLDLVPHSPMGLSLGGGSGSSQLALSVLATASNNKIALLYYEDFKPFLLEALSRRVKNISYIEIQQWLIKRKRKDMENIVKYVCSELDMTQKALSEEIGVSEGTVNRWSAKPDEVPLQTQKTLQLLLENAQLKENQQKLQQALSLLEEVKNTQNISIF